MKDYFHFSFVTKPYLAKYLQTLYGSPIVFEIDNYFGTTLYAFLTKKVFYLKETKIEHRKFDQFTTKLDVYLPSYWLRNAKYRTDLTRENIIYINKHFEERFEEDLIKHCHVLSLFGIEFQEAMEDFCKQFDIEIDEDITFEALKKKEYRERKKLVQNLNKKPRAIQPRFF